MSLRYDARPVLVALIAFGAMASEADELSTMMEQVPARSRERVGPADNAVLRLQQQIESGEAHLSFDGPAGYLHDLLSRLNVAVASQNLVFSKTSLQQVYIGPTQPRAIYFNDDAYVAYVVDGGLIEIAVADPVEGTQFYMLPQSGENAGRLLQQQDNCLRCHHGGRTEGVAGHIAQSVIVGKAGEPRGIATNNRIDHTTPLAERWGGWYVTGTHSNVVHLGNYLSTDLLPKKPTEVHDGVNLTDVSDRFDASFYLVADSDIVAMLIREHQTRAHNLLSKVVDEAQFRPGKTTKELDEALDHFARYVLFIDEAELPGPIEGTTKFAEKFQELGPFDSQGRSLRQLELNSRLLRFRCSYLVYSESFRRLPETIRLRFWQRFLAVLKDSAMGIANEDSDAIREILLDTVPEFASVMDEKLPAN